MVAAASGSNPQTHTSTAKVWHENIASKGFAVGPFGLSLNTLVDKDIKNQITILRNGNNFELVNSPNSEDEAYGAVYSYLSGTAKYERERTEEQVKKTKEFKELGVENFRTIKAQKLRDTRLTKGFVNFLVQSIRYRGKANYRDSIYLSYGENRTDSIKPFIKNLNTVSSTFLKMACFYISKRVEKDTWHTFEEDLKRNLRLDVDLKILMEN